MLLGAVLEHGGHGRLWPSIIRQIADRVLVQLYAQSWSKDTQANLIN